MPLVGWQYLFLNPAESDLAPGRKSSKCLMDLHVKVTDQLKEYIITPTPENVWLYENQVALFNASRAVACMGRLDSVCALTVQLLFAYVH